MGFLQAGANGVLTDPATPNAWNWGCHGASSFQAMPLAQVRVQCFIGVGVVAYQPPSEAC